MTLPDDEAAARALAQGLVTPAQVEAARRRVAMLRQAGMPADLLGALAAGLPPAQVAALRGLAGARPAGGAGATVAPARAVTFGPGTGPGGGPGAGPVPTSPGPRPVAGLPGPGDRVGPYVVERELGRGGMGVVYVARHAALGRQVALKLRLPGHPRADERFLREGQAAASLRHAAIVAVHDAGRDDAGRLFIAMDLVEGEALDARLERAGPLEPREAARLAGAVARGLEHAHARGVLHRDLKPANILVRPDGAPLILDFGLAKVVAGAESLTRTGEILGTPAYMPPEQANAREAEPRGDIWSLGATLYHLLVGAPPFEGVNLVGVLAAVMRADVVPPRRTRPEVPAALDAIVLRCLRRAPDERYPSAAALAEDLERFLERGGSAAADAARARRLRLALAAGVGAAVLLVAAALVASLPTSPPPDAVAAAPGSVTPAPTLEPSPSPLPASAPAADPAPEVVARPEDGFVAPGVWVPWRADHAAPRPRARWSHAMVWDARRRVVVVVGGRDKEEVFDDQWVWDGAAWREETPRRRPPPRYAAAAGYDEARGRLVLHGGGASKDDRAGHADTWEFDGERWEPRPDAGGPGLRGWHRMAWDPARRRLVLLGGADPRWRAHADLWSWDGARWAALPAGPAPAPPGRHLFGMCWDARRDVLVVYGAQSGPGMDEHWEWHPERGWARRDNVEGGPGKRHDPGLVAYPGGVLFFGGWDDRRARNDTWSFDGARWTRLLEGVTGDAFLPPGRNWQALVWDAGRGCAVLHGGAASGRGHGDLWELRP